MEEQLQQMKAELLRLKEYKNANIDLLERLEQRISVQDYKVYCTRDKLYTERIKDLEEDIYFEEVKSCNHIIAKVDNVFARYNYNEPNRNLPVYYCIKCQITNLYNIIGPETLLQRDMAIAFNNIKISDNQIIDLTTSKKTIEDVEMAYEKSKMNSNNLENDVIIPKIKQLLK